MTKLTAAVKRSRKYESADGAAAALQEDAVLLITALPDAHTTVLKCSAKLPAKDAARAGFRRCLQLIRTGCLQTARACAMLLSKNDGLQLQSNLVKLFIDVLESCTGGTFRSYDLRVMSPARFHCATPVKTGVLEYRRYVSIVRPQGYEPCALPLRHAGRRLKLLK